MNLLQKITFVIASPEHRPGAMERSNPRKLQMGNKIVSRQPTSLPAEFAMTCFFSFLYKPTNLTI